MFLSPGEYRVVFMEVLFYDMLGLTFLLIVFHLCVLLILSCLFKNSLKLVAVVLGLNFFSSSSN
jgi:hypothetical protein